MTSGRILIIDDSKKWGRTLGELVDQSEMLYDVCLDRFEATDKLSRESYKLVLLDICLHGGKITIQDQILWAFLQENYPGLPVIAVSGRDLSPERVWSLTRWGFVDFIDKRTIDIDKFKKNIQDHMLSPGIKTPKPKGKKAILIPQDKDKSISIEELHALLAESKINDAIQELLQMCKYDNELIIKIILQSARLHRMEEQVRDGLLVDADGDVIRAKVIGNLIHIIKELF